MSRGARPRGFHGGWNDGGLATVNAKLRDVAETANKVCIRAEYGAPLVSFGENHANSDDVGAGLSRKAYRR